MSTPSIATSCGLTGIIGPSKPALKRLWASTAPIERGCLLAPTSAIERGWSRTSRLRMDIVRLCRSFGLLPGSAEHRCEQRGELSEAEIAVSRILIREQILPRRAQQKMQHTKLEHRREPDPEKTDTKPCLERVALRRPADEQSCGQNDQENEQERRERQRQLGSSAAPERCLEKSHWRKRGQAAQARRAARGGAGCA